MKFVVINILNTKYVIQNDFVGPRNSTTSELNEFVYFGFAF